MTRTGSRKIKAIIVDDEPPARRNLRALLKGFPNIELVKECGNGRDAVSSIRALEPDLVFLDVQMPEMDGFEVLEHLTDQPLPVIIFVTAYDQLNPEQFARIHRSTIVNLDRVKELHPHFNEHLVVLRDGTELKLSRTRKEWLEQWLRRGAR